MDNKTKPPQRRSLFRENPYDIETVFEALSSSTDQDKELLFVDRLISSLRHDPNADLTNLCFDILRELNVINPNKI
jgi:hypothetical protein